MILIFIILTLLALAILYFAAIALVFVVMFLTQAILLATGRTTMAELNEKAEQAKRDRQAKQKTKTAKGDFSFLSYPSPLNDWGLWN